MLTRSLCEYLEKFLSIRRGQVVFRREPCLTLPILGFLRFLLSGGIVFEAHLEILWSCSLGNSDLQDPFSSGFVRHTWVSQNSPALMFTISVLDMAQEA